MWNPLDAIKKKISGAPATDAKGQPLPKELAEAAKAGGGMPDMKELEKKGMLGQFLRRWKDPAFLKQLKVVAARMQADGVNIKDQNAVKAWIEAHQQELSSGKIEAPAAETPQTYVKAGPDVGRNDPCTCGSGKKFKKCCGK